MKSLIGKKIGMTQVFGTDGTLYPVTVIDVSDVKVARKISDSQIELGAGKKKKASKGDAGQYKELGYVPAFRECIDLDGEVPEIGSTVSIDDFTPGKKVNVQGITKGKGFQGVVKRWRFAGGPATHGQSDKHRHPGSIGQRMTPGRVYKGMKMGGHMGDRTKTVSGLKLVNVDTENKLLLVEGAIPGNKGGFVVVSIALKK